MPDIMFPAKVIITREVDIHGLPVTTAELELDEAAAALPLPSGREGDPGQRGRPRATWVKRGTVTNASALTILDPADRDFGHWWHNLATNGMETWTATGWVSSPGAVGARGVVAAPYTLTMTGTVSDPTITTAASVIFDTGPAQTAKVTVPAGPQGPRGNAGVSSKIIDSADVDTNPGPSAGSILGWDRGTAKFRSMPGRVRPGPWQTAYVDFAEDSDAIDSDRQVMATLSIPALPYAWRPSVHGLFRATSSGGNSYINAHVRIGDPSGEICALGTNPWSSGDLVRPRPIIPFFGARMTPGVDNCVVQPNMPVTLYLSMERSQAANPWKWRRAYAFLCCYAQPVVI
ncbi:hypothetical protein [Rhodococcus sp. 3-2]|uniref:hypothetical protein n=1 Tax=Rhodococcus sp. 3-2 TaxID=2890836 RepID=UPI001D18E1EE|nr:hypothetical protein [Rhodococcus sp. 3-2]MCC4300437.1 hypothetical protein [Rhodococcus sp. 3-2]